MRRNKKGQFTSRGSMGKENVRWNNNIGYSGVHQWLRHKHGVAIKCVDCGSTKNVQWANINNKYKRNIKDWKQLCAPCHRKFDGIAKLSKEDAIKIKHKYNNGKKQWPLAKEYGVDQGTISNIINNKIKYYSL